MRKEALLVLMATFLLGTTSIHPANGKEYPVRTIELICPYSAGGNFDLYSRLIAEKLEKILGQPAVVINKPGGGGSTVVADLISSKPDGYKLGVLGNVYFYTTVKTQKVPFDPSDLVPIANLVELKIGLQVKGDSPYKTLDQLLEYGKNNPGKLKWGHASRGVTTYLNTRLLFEKAGIKTIDIPYKGAPEAIAALMGGHLDAISYPHGAVAGQIKAGTLRHVVVFGEERYRDMPDVPCSKELGFAETAKMRTLLGIYAHRETPEEIKKTLFAACKMAYEDAEFRKGVEKIGDEPRFYGPGVIVESISMGAEVGVPILKELGIFRGD
jgi:tripartite-type tricarboxylate transporter receptor subunit TctC